jgi:hypothetical protein
VERIGTDRPQLPEQPRQPNRQTPQPSPVSENSVAQNGSAIVSSVVGREPVLLKPEYVTVQSSVAQPKSVKKKSSRHLAAKASALLAIGLGALAAGATVKFAVGPVRLDRYRDDPSVARAVSLGGEDASDFRELLNIRAGRILLRKPALASNQRFLSAYPDLAKFLETHPELRAHLLDDAQLASKTSFVRPGSNPDGAEKVDARLAEDFKDFLDRHADIANDLKKDPTAATQDKYLAQHGELNDYLAAHPEIFALLQAHPQAIVRAMSEDDRNKELGAKSDGDDFADGPLREHSPPVAHADRNSRDKPADAETDDDGRLLPSEKHLFRADRHPTDYGVRTRENASSDDDDSGDD